VRINDRGPFSKKRLIDLSYAAARELGMLSSGVAPVEIEILN
jgi:rare lipoprotein A